ncbi:MAG: hypothetical protein MJY88_06165 [Bacteroidales bacterium]|nr:hypothetical protein [Bacteroidales bacterium]
MEKNTYNWKFKSIGGTSRVDISCGEDIKHLGELDQKLWTVLSCPTTGLEFDQKTLEIIDKDKDGKIRVGEIVAAAEYLTSAVKDADLLLKGEDTIALSQFNEGSETGKKLHDSAKQILANLGLDKDSISLAESGDSVAIFANSRFNGDGVITPASTDDEALKAVIEAAVAATGGVADRSGVQGVNADQIEAFYAACADYSAWCAAKSAEGVLPYGDNTEAALAAVEAVKDKIADYFMRCKLSVFDEETIAALDVQVAKVSEISANNLSACTEEIASYPLARINGSSELPLDGINPAWQAAIASVKSLVLDVDYPEAKAITEEQWNAVVAKFAAYSAWKGAKAGSCVEALGLEKIDEILKADAKAALLALVDQDKALESEANSIDEVDRFIRLYKNFYGLLRNYVTMDDFYDKDCTAIFQAGKLYLDQRCLDLCIKVADMGKHGDMAGLSGMFIIYCNCVSKSTGKSMTIAAVLTEGRVDNLRVGTNAIFYDRDGVDYDATVTKIVDNPVSVRQAFLAPYKKFGRTISERINKSVAEKEAKSMSSITDKANAVQIPTAPAEGEAAAPAAPKAPFDIAKFAGIFAAFGMALGMIGTALMSIINPVKNVFILLAVVVVAISGPSVIMAWMKLRKRNLAPVLNANGWAVNAHILVNVAFGSYFTQLAKFPALESVDPKLASKRRWRRFRNFVLLLAVLCGVGFYCYKLREKRIAAEAERAAFVADSIARAEADAAALLQVVDEAPAETPASEAESE